MSNSEKAALDGQLAETRTWQDRLAEGSMTGFTAGVAGSLIEERDPRTIAKLARAVAPVATVIGAVSGVGYFIAKWRGDSLRKQIDSATRTVRADAGHLHADKIQQERDFDTINHQIQM